ncbi:acyl-CoA dehydrogenase [Verticiella sediminum]|uniref:Acyl-CoA dehydrogenase n=1 Tax=Verticiella sediminum TaxID=1247510 RepID=A0A556AZR8_9BURK|nr:acyl-CoA dehydrogenase family protein [Verticiella sediminum]TSH97955.1 acyl-CoA dehydrogenase [Verticiella sediminum]
MQAITAHVIPPREEALRAEIRAFLQAQLQGMPAERRARSWMGFDAGFSRALAERGWVGLTLPTEYGGAGLGHFARFVLVEELLCAGAPVSAHWIADRQSAPLLLNYGTEAQRRFYIPRICRAEAFFCIGMSEPGSGSDLASVRTRAVPSEGGWRLNGSKIWTTNAHRSHYMIALVRTSGNPDDRHQGLSQFVIDLKTPGVSVRPITDLAGDAHFSEVFFSDVFLPDDALIGSEGDGWKQVNAELAFERSGPERLYSSMVLIEGWLALLRTRAAAGAGLRGQDTELLGRMLGQLAVLRSLSVGVTARLAEGESPLLEAALVKELGTTFEQWVPRAVADALAAQPELPVPAELARTVAYLMQVAPTFSLRGGTREILRGMIARGLGLR